MSETFQIGTEHISGEDAYTRGLRAARMAMNLTLRTAYQLSPNDAAHISGAKEFYDQVLGPEESVTEIATV